MEKEEVIVKCDVVGLTSGQIDIIYNACSGSSDIIGCINNKAEEYRNLATEEKKQYIEEIKEENIKAVANFNSENLTKQTQTL